ncbi:MAG: DUF547 domain-containing protein [Proteobacteria bacterium]|nr:DUF547 domain-containing protein [Pseudomonadota bacterium]
MKPLYVWLAALLLWAGAAHAQPNPTFFQPYDDLLQTHVSDGVVSYSGWAQDPRHKAVMDMLHAARPDTLQTDAEKMAFWINAYNLMTIDLIVSNGEKQSIKNLGGWLSTAWTGPKWQIGDKSYTLDQIENNILRPMGQPLVHMALNCASKSCPILNGRAYRADILDNQLRAQAMRFVRDDKRGLKITGSGTADISMIFKWYADDFGGVEGVQAFIATYHGDNPPLLVSGYLPYDWSLNGTWE